MLGLLERRAALLWLMIAGCSYEEQLALTPPLRNSAKTMVLAIEPTGGQGSIDRAYAVSLSTAVQPINFDADNISQITALLYDRTLEELELVEGQLMRADPSAPSRDLPAADEAFALDLPDARAWAPSENRRVDFKIPAASPCPQLTATAVEIDTLTGQPETGVNIDNESALVFFSDGGWWRVDPNGATRVADRERVRAAWRADTGDLWIVTSTGTLLRGDLERGFTVTATLPIALEGAAIDGSHFPAPLEMFIMIDDKMLARFDGQGARVVDDRHEAGGAEIDVAWVDAGTAIAIGQLERALLRYENGAGREELFQQIFNVESPSSLMHHAQLGSFLGTNNGFFYRRRLGEPTWNPLGRVGAETFGATVEQLTPWGDGVAIGVGRGQISFFFESYPACPLQQLGDRHYKALLTVGDDLVIIPNQTDSDRPPYQMLWISASR